MNRKILAEPGETKRHYARKTSSRKHNVNHIDLNRFVKVENNQAQEAKRVQVKKMDR
jgi:hypothetical protein